MEQEQHNQFFILHDHEEQQEKEELDDVGLKRTTFINGGGLRNGDYTLVKDPNGYSLQKEEEVEETVKNGEKNNFFGDEAVGLGLVAEFVETERNGGAIGGVTFGADVSDNKNSVYFDKIQGSEVNSVQNGERNHEECEFDVQVENSAAAGSEVNSVQNGERNHEECEFDVQVENSAIQNGLCSEVNDQCMRIADEKVPSSSELSSLHDSSDIHAKADANSCEEIKEVGPNLINEIEQQEKEFDVELVLAKQETHDLFCPNCKSCITKRVILKKRKRNIHNLNNKAKRDKLDVVSPELVPTPEANRVDPANVTPEITSPEPSSDNDHPEREVEVFRCLSCLSIFIPSGMFRNFGGTSKNETSQNPSRIAERDSQNPSNLPGSNANWFISLFTSNKVKMATEQGNTSSEHSRTSPAEQNNSTSITSNMPSSPDIGHPEGPLADTSLVVNVKPMLDTNDGHGIMNEDEKTKTSVVTTKTNTVEVMSSVSSSNETVSKYESVQSVTSTTCVTHSNSKETAKDAILSPCEEEPESHGFTAAGSTILEKSKKDVDKTPDIVAIVNTGSFFREGAPSPVQTFGSTVITSDGASNIQGSGINAILPSKQDVSLIEKARQVIDEINASIGNENEGGSGDVIVTVEGETNETTPFLTDDNVPVNGAVTTGYQTQVGEQTRDEIGEPRQWEILKSIVYGGLVESITSLGIVSSAASSGATPLNIIALGFANLIGGLVILGHNLSDLKNDHSGQDRYQELLGRRANFWFHAVVAVLSFLIFGGVPLVIYGLLINKNYYDEVKVAIVAATSVVCIILLVIAKVYTKRPPKSYIKTVLYYVTMAVATSGISYMAGNLFKDLLDKFSHSESGFAITMPMSETSMETAWRSY